MAQGAEIFDNAVCGGGDPNQGLTSTAIPISAGALQQIKAVILQGTPTYVYGLSYDVGTCRAGGVRCQLFHHSIDGHTDIYISSTPAQRASCALLPPRSSLTAMLRILTAATAATQTHTKDMGLNMAQQRSLSSRVSSVARLLARQPRLLLHLRRQHPAPGHALLFMRSAVVRDGLARRAVPPEPARPPIPTILSACEISG